MTRTEASAIVWRWSRQSETAKEANLRNPVRGFNYYNEMLDDSVMEIAESLAAQSAFEQFERRVRVWWAYAVLSDRHS